MVRIVLCLAVAATLLAARDAAAGDPRIPSGRLEFAIADLDGQEVTSSDERFAGKVVLVDLWATWCPPCLSSIPTFVDLARRLGPQGLVVVGIAFEAEEDSEARRGRLREFAGSRGIDYLVLDGGRPDDFAASLPGLEGVRGFPIEILIGRDGCVAAVRNGYGYSKRWARRLEREVGELLARSATSVDPPGPGCSKLRPS